MRSLRLRREQFFFYILWCFCILSSACLVRRRTTTPQGQPATRPPLSATKAELISRIHAVFDPVQSFSMKVDMSPSVGMLHGGQVTDYPTITGYILFQKPDSIRVIGLDPVIHSTGFDMVSMGNDFRVSIPSKSRFIEGRNDSTATSKNKLENLRPAAFLNALLIRPPDDANDISFAEDDTNESKAVYILMMIGHDGGQYFPVRNVYFDRYTLQITRQKTFDKAGEIVSETRYSNWSEYNRVAFPALIDVQRPKDGYEVELKIVDMKMNAGDVNATKFVLNQPANTQLTRMP